ncbi:MAG TPA: 16S rRNA (guanine(527)-N(7))-methyltransferase RsmG [Candidatus Cloacimonetes bacterium]|nr:16S rRNA (guanine(527)-N(7))-methyltransferase RsmG [Candidatus Cloacimonadota bacterium]
MEGKEYLREFISKKNLDEISFAQFEKYESLLLEKNKKFNLISKNTESEIWSKHFFDSVLIAEHLDFNNTSVLDFGSGAGFPGIPLKIIFPSMKLYCLESTRKKTLFLKLLVQELELETIQIINDRIENLDVNYNDFFDILLVRAVKMSDEYLKKAFEILRSDGSLIVYKSTIDDNEVDKINALSECQTIKLQRIEKDVPWKRAFIIAKKR